ncbi:hypothetical protein D3C74_256220 [compost metagenome]
MNKEGLRKLFIGVLESYQVAEESVIYERGGINDLAQLEQDVESWKAEFESLLGDD